MCADCENPANEHSSVSLRSSVRQQADLPASMEASEVLVAIDSIRSSSGVMQRIPKGARALAAETLHKVIDAVISSNSFQDWVKLFSFASQALRCVPRDSKLTSSLASFAKKSLAEFSDGGNIFSALSSTENNPKSSNCSVTEDNPEALRRRVKSKLMDGDLGATVRVASSDDTIMEASPGVLLVLAKKHPEAPLVTEELPTPSSIGALQLARDEVLQSIKSFPSSSSGGIDGLRPCHMKDLVHRAVGEPGAKLLSSVTALINFFLSGNLNPEARRLFFSARLVAFKKKDGGVRPIAVGNFFRRLASKAAVNSVSSTLSPQLSPVQLFAIGVGVANGCEAAVHAARAFVEASSPENRGILNHIMIKLDVCNAFNSVRRDHLLSKIHSRAPSLYPLAWAAYSSSSPLLFDGNLLESASGVQQGDPLGPLAFALAVDDVAQEVSCPFNVWYLDDATIGGPADCVISDLHRLIPALARIGLSVNPKKCELVNLGYPDNTFKDIHDTISSLLPSITVVRASRLELLGAPILKEAIRCTLPMKKAQLETMISRLRLIDAHPALFLLRNCFAMPRLLYTLRAAPCFREKSLLQELDDVIRKGASDICNVSFDDLNWQQATLPVRLGGIGLRSPSTVSFSAYASSFFASRTLSRLILSDPIGSDAVETAICEEWADGGCEVPVVKEKQRLWDDSVCAVIVEDLRKRLNVRRRAALEGAALPHSGSWLFAIPHPSIGTYLDNQTLRIAVALRVGARVCEQHLCRCGDTVDCFGHHPLSCKRSAGRFPRHAALNDVLKRALGRAGFPSILEPSGLDRGDGKRPDGITLFPFSKGRALVWDATCSDTFSPGSLLNSATSPGTASRKAEEKKEKKYNNLKDRYMFEPFAFETCGGIGPRTFRTLSSVGQMIASQKDDPREIEWLFQQCSLAIVRGNSHSILASA